MGLTQERGGLGISLHRGCIILPPPPLFFFVGSALVYTIPRQVMPLGKNKAGLDWTLPLFRFGLESCVQAVSSKTEGAGSARLLAFLLATNFLNNRNNKSGSGIS